MPCMGDEVHVNPDGLRAASSGWHMEVSELHAALPSLQPPAPWPTMLAAAGVTGAAQVATADLHTQIAATAGMTQVAATGYEATDSDAADLLKNVAATITGTVRNT
ncbi:hypothetical protein A4G28_04075 [Mycobacterium ostraviense]|nr:hypothetical protein A4G28_04075 [Mycobacterium ostraviense]